GRAPRTCEAFCLPEVNWYPTRNVGASEAVQISANCGECLSQCMDHIRYEKLPERSIREGSDADVERYHQISKLGSRPGARVQAHRARQARIEPESRGGNELPTHSAVSPAISSWSVLHLQTHPLRRQHHVLVQICHDPERPGDDQYDNE